MSTSLQVMLSAAKPNTAKPSDSKDTFRSFILPGQLSRTCAVAWTSDLTDIVLEVSEEGARGTSDADRCTLRQFLRELEDSGIADTTVNSHEIKAPVDSASGQDLILFWVQVLLIHRLAGSQTMRCQDLLHTSSSPRRIVSTSNTIPCRPTSSRTLHQRLPSMTLCKKCMSHEKRPVLPSQSSLLPYHPRSWTQAELWRRYGGFRMSRNQMNLGII